MLDLKPLHRLYQQLIPSSHPELPHPLIALAELTRKPSSSNGELGALEWVVGLGGKSQQPQAAATQKKGRKRRDPTADDEWWEAKMGQEEVEAWITETKSALSPQKTVEMIRTKWLAGELRIEGYGAAGDLKQGLELIIDVSETLALPLILEPCDSAPLSVLSILAEIIPPFLTCTADRQTCSTATQERDTLRAKVLKLDGELKRYKEEERDSKRRRVGERQGSFSQSQSQSQGGRGESQGAESPTKVPGQSHRGKLNFGDPGFAGSGFRPGRVVVEDDFDTASDSD